MKDMKKPPNIDFNIKSTLTLQIIIVLVFFLLLLYYAMHIISLKSQRFLQLGDESNSSAPMVSYSSIKPAGKYGLKFSWQVCGRIILLDSYYRIPLNFTGGNVLALVFGSK